MFWALTILISIIVGAITLWPLLSASSPWRLTAVAGLLIIPLLTGWMYLGVGTPQALEVETLSAAPAEGGDMASLTEELRQKLAENPDEFEGWLLLGRSYKTLQQFPQAVEALETALSLQPDQPLIMVELVEARLFASGNPRMTAEMITQLEQAVALDPSVQKGLWLLGIASAQTGDDTAAINWWQRLLQQLEPGGQITLTVQEQITLAQQRLGVSAPLPPQQTNEGGWPGLNITVELDPAQSESIAQDTADAVLFIIVRANGTAGGPPLGVKRFDQPQFPLQFTLTDADSMMAARPVSSAASFDVQARMSLSGQPLSSVGDWQSTVHTSELDSGNEIRLLIDQQKQ